MAKSAKTSVSEYTRELADGTKVTVHSHQRAFTPGVAAEGHSTPVESHRKNRLKEQARARRRNALEKGRAAAGRGLQAIKKRGKQSATLARRGGKRMARGARYASRKRRGMAAACMVGGVAEIGAGLAWSTAGLVWTTLSIIAATIGGALVMGGKKKPAPASQPARPKPRAKTSRTRRTGGGGGIVHPKPKQTSEQPSDLTRQFQAFQNLQRLQDQSFEARRQEARRRRTER
jgi:hypothetical protein